MNNSVNGKFIVLGDTVQCPETIDLSLLDKKDENNDESNEDNNEKQDN